MFHLQGGSSCFCDNQFGRYGIGDTCYTQCSGDYTAICGGWDRNNVYALNGWYKNTNVCGMRYPTWQISLINEDWVVHKRLSCAKIELELSDRLGAWIIMQLPYQKPMLAKKTFRSWLLIDWQHSCHPTRSQDGKIIVNQHWFWHGLSPMGDQRPVSLWLMTSQFKDIV